MFGVRKFGTLPFGRYPDPAGGYMSVIVRHDVSLKTTYEIFVATREFITTGDDDPADQPFSGMLDQPLNFRRSILGSDGISGFLHGQGEMVMKNGGEFDFLPQFYALDGRDQEIRMGRTDLNYANWFTIFKGTATSFHVDEAEFRIDLEDYRYKLDVPLHTTVYGGTGGVEGGDDLAGRRKPRAFGHLRNVTPVLVKANSQLYQINDGPVNAISAVYANGAALTAGSDHANSADLLAASIASGFFDTCLAEGMFRVNYLLDGDVLTCDVEGDTTGGSFAETIGAIVRRIVAGSTVMSDPGDLYLPAFVAFEAAAPYQAGFYADHNDAISVAEALARLVGYGNFVGFRRTGKLEIAQFAAPASPPLMRFDDKDIVGIRRERLPDGIYPPPWRWRVAYGRNWTVQDELAGSVADNVRAFLAEELRYASAESAATKINHPFAQEREVGGYLRNEADAQSEANRLLALHASSSSLYRFTLDTRPFGLDVGDTVHVTYPRFDLSDGRLMRVVEINENAADDAAEIVGFG
ncbi:MAG: hypothetical protein Rhirs2KO_18550 [Rhizobiaceae bacterium]